MATARLAVVTGVSSGIGHAIVAALLKSGWRVVGLSRRPATLESEGFRWAACDLTDADSIRSAARMIQQEESPVTAIVHAAGLQFAARLGELSDEGGRTMWDVHVAAAQRLADALVGDLVDGGRIVLLGSRGGAGVGGKSQYAATKAALSALARSWAIELAPRRIAVNVVAPGPTQTPMLADPNRAGVPVVLPPFGRLITPDEVSGLVMFLLEPSGDMITGQTLVICGGTSLS